MCTGGGSSNRSKPKPSARSTMTRQPNPDVMRGARVSGQFTQAQVRDQALTEIRQRIDKPLFKGSALNRLSMFSPSGQVLKRLGRNQLKKRAKALAGGAVPVQIKSSSGKTITVGAIDSAGRYTGQENYREYARSQIQNKDFGSIRSIEASKRGIDKFNKDRERGSERDNKSKARTQTKVAKEEDVIVGSPSRTSASARRASGRRSAMGTRQSLISY